MNNISRKLRKTALYLSNRCQDGNLQSVFSCLDIIWVLYDQIMNWTPEIATNDNRDYFIISKGQATLALYPVLIEKNFFDLEEVSSEIGNFDSRYCIQTDLTKFEGGIENNAGSLGHGYPFATGIAHAAKVRKLDSFIYVLCGDGEFCEGTMWETCLFASTHKLDNLCVIIDDNDSVGVMVDMGSIGEKLRSFGFEVYNVDGHDINALNKVFTEARNKLNGRPKAVIAKTVRGYGSKTLTNEDVWFHKAPNDAELCQLIKEVDEF